MSDTDSPIVKSVDPRKYAAKQIFLVLLGEAADGVATEVGHLNHSREATVNVERRFYEIVNRCP